MTTKRRGRGEGSIYRRKSDGRWVGTVTITDDLGRPRRKSVYGATRKQVADRLAGVQVDVHTGRGVADDRNLLGTFLDEWLAMVKANREHATWAGYEQRVRLYIKPALGNRPLTKLTVGDVQRLLDGARKHGLSARSVQYVHATLRASLGVAERWGLVVRNVAALAEPVTVRRRVVEPFSVEEVQRLLEVADRIALARSMRSPRPSGCGQERRWVCAGWTWTSMASDLSCVSGRRSRWDRKESSCSASRRRLVLAGRSHCQPSASEH